MPDRCEDCGNERPVHRVGCPGCISSIIRERPKEEWEAALANVATNWGHRRAFEVGRRLSLPLDNIWRASA